MRFRAGDGTRLLGIGLGTGTTGVVLGHENRANLCSWMPFARTLARAGFRVLAFDHRGFGSSARGPVRYDKDVVGAIAEIRRRARAGSSRGGASMGGAAAIVGGVAARADAVFGLSPPAVFAGLDAVAAVRSYDRPLLVAAGALEPDFPDEARRIFEASPATEKHLELPPTGFPRNRHPRRPRSRRPPCQARRLRARLGPPRAGVESPPRWRRCFRPSASCGA